MDLTSNTHLVEELRSILTSIDIEGREYLTETFYLLHSEKNADGSKKLILKGNEMQMRLKRRIDEIDVVSLTLFLKKFPEYIHLDLCYNNIGDGGLLILAQYSLCNINNLEHLNLMYCDITERGILHFCRYLMSEELTVRDLRLNGNKFGPNAGIELAQFLTDNIFVEYLDIAETDQTLESINHFMILLNENYGNNKEIKVLDISRPILNFDRYNYDPSYLATIFSDMLRYNKTLIEFHIQKCQLDSHDIEIFARGLEYNNTLLFLDIGLNNIGDDGIEILSKYLRKGPNLLGLNVSANAITDVGARALCLAMPFSRIRLLDITHNHITDKGKLFIVRFHVSILNTPNTVYAVESDFSF